MYSFIEAAIFVVVVGVLVLLWARAERKAFHLPGGDGTVVMGAGLWVMFLIFYRQFDRPNRVAWEWAWSVDWGIFIAFLLGALLAYAGYRIRASHVPEPLVDDAPPPRPRHGARAAAADPAGAGPDAEDTVVARAGARRTATRSTASSPSTSPPSTARRRAAEHSVPGSSARCSQ